MTAEHAADSGADGNRGHDGGERSITSHGPDASR
jgi:hypothetical protein